MGVGLGRGANKSGLRLILNCNFLECIVVIPFKHKKKGKEKSLPGAMLLMKWKVFTLIHTGACLFPL